MNSGSADEPRNFPSLSITIRNRHASVLELQRILVLYVIESMDVTMIPSNARRLTSAVDLVGNVLFPLIDDVNG